MIIVLEFLMADCFNCGEEYSNKRKSLGYSTCLSCGECNAYEEAVAKSKRVAPIYNKGAAQYLTDGMIADDLKTIGKKV